MSSRFVLSRRAALRGLGAVVGLPLLEAMIPARAFAQSVVAPKRMVLMFAPCGMVMNQWTPATAGTAYTLSPILQPLAALKADLLVLSKLQNNSVYDPNGAHATGTAGAFSGVHPGKSVTSLSNGITADQVVARFMQGKTKFASLELGTSGGSNTGDCDCGYSCAYTRNVSWPGGAAPNPKETNPLNVFNRLFGAGTTPAAPAAAAKQKAYHLSVLDRVQDDAARLKAQLGAGDNLKLDEYLTGVRDLELRVNAMSTGQSCAPGAAPGAPVDLRDTAKAMADLLVMAFKCDLTRSATFMLQNGGSENTTPFAFLGLPNSHHAYSHYQNAADIAALQKINTWEIEQLAYLGAQLKATQDVDGKSLLDNSFVYFTSEISDGNDHNVDNLPALVLGRAGGAVNPGRHVVLTRQPAVADVLLAAIQSTGATATSFAGSSTPLPELK